MTESLFQILLLIAYLNIGLISVTIATYAIAVSYSGREISRALWRTKKRQKQLKLRVKGLVETATVDEMKGEIQKYDQEMKKLGGKLLYLSVKGAVWLPCFFFFLALVSVVYDIYVDPGVVLISNIPTNISELVIWLGAVSTSLGALFLGKTLATVESVASRIPLPRFEVTFEGLETKRLKKGDKGVSFTIFNAGDDIAEDLAIFFFFPPQFKITKRPYYTTTFQASYTDHPGYTAVIYKLDRLHIDIYKSVPLYFETKDTGSYTIPIRIHESKTGVTDHKLTLEIVS